METNTKVQNKIKFYKLMFNFSFYKANVFNLTTSHELPNKEVRFHNYKGLLLFKTASCKGIFFKNTMNITDGNRVPYDWPAPELTDFLFAARIVLVSQVSFKVV